MAGFRYAGGTTVYANIGSADPQYGYAGLSALDPRVAAGGIGPQGTIPGATIHAVAPPTFNVPTTGLPAQSTAYGFGPVTVAAPLNPSNENVRARGGPITYSGVIRTPRLPRARGTPISAGSGLVNDQLGSFPSARGGPIRPRNFIGHQII